MKGSSICICFLVVGCSILSGCSVLEPSVAPISAQDAVTLATAQETSKVKCLEAMIAKANNDLLAMEKMSQDQAYNFLIMQQLSNANDNATTVSLAIIEWASGGKVKRHTGQCDASNIWDYFAATDAAKYEMVGKIIEGGFRIMNTVVDGVITYWLADGSGAIASEGGISLNESDGNIIMVSSDELAQNASKTVSLSNTPTKKTQVQTGTDDSVNGEGTYSLDNSHDNGASSESLPVTDTVDTTATDTITP